MTTFSASLQRSFPGSVPSDAYLAHVRATVEPLGFTRDRTLPLVSICRDELTAHFADQIEDEWGHAFALAGLGGVPALGRTGWGAALSHIPDEHGRGCLLVLGFPHIGIEEDGTVGVTRRRGQSVPTPTCGALASIYQRAKDGTLPSGIDVDDYEATKLAHRLVDPEQPPSSLVELTHQALEALEIDLWRAIDEQEVWRQHDVAVWCGVQIHGRADNDWIWPRDAWLVGDDRVRRSLPGPTP